MFQKSTKKQNKIRALLTFVAVVCLCATGFAQWNTWCYNDFKTTGSHTFTLPANCDGIVVEAIGGGGAGGAAVIGGGIVSFHFASAGGGGGAAYARQNSHQSTNMASQTLTIYVGKGGTSLTNGTVTNGESSWVKFNSTTLVSAAGGNSAAGRFSIYRDGLFDTNVETTPGANGGKASECIGSTCYSGGNGSVGADTRTTGAGSDGNRIRGGAGGGAAGGNGNGSNGYTNTAKVNESQPQGGAGGAGNASGLISGVNWLTGGAGANGTYGGNGWESEIPGNNYGGGGAGTRVQETASNNSHNGSAGAQGIVRVWFHITKNDVQLTVNPASADIASGESVTLTASSSNLMGTPSYKWSTSATTNAITVAPTATTTYTVTLTDTYAPSCVATLSKNVEVTVDMFNVTLGDITGNTAFCAGGSTTLTASATATKGTPTYAWSTGATTNTITVTEAGNYTVTASVTVDGVTKTDSKTVTVTVNPLPTFTITKTNETCKGHDGTASVSLSGVSYLWNNGETTQTIDELSAGNYDVTVTDGNGCQNTGTTTITLNNSLEMDPITGPAVCTGTEFNIFPSDVPEGTTYSWPAPAAISGISGLEGLNDQTSIHGVLGNTTGSPVTVSYTVTPKLGICTGNAVGVTVTVTTTVNPGVTVTIPATMTKCANAEVEIPVEFVNSYSTHDVKWVLKGTTDTVTHSGLTVATDKLNVTLPSTCSAEYTYLVYYVDNSGCVANDGCVITVNSGTWSIPQNDTVTVACVSDAQTRPANADLTPVSDGCGNPTTPNYVVSEVTYESGLVTKVDHKYRYTACDGTYKVWHCVKIINNAAPVLTCESNQSVNTDAGKNYATLTFAAPQATDDCGTPTVAVTYSPATPTNATTTNASGQYPIGTTTVTYTATDDRNNTATCSFTVTVADNEAPVITAPADIEVDNYNDVPAPFTTLDEFIAGGGTATDNVGIDPNTFRYTNESDGNKCPETFTRTYFISDNAGNEASDVQLVVVNDNIAPTFIAPADVTICRNTADGSFDARTTITGIPNPATFSDNNTPVANLRTQYVDLDILPENDNEMRVLRREWRVLDECDNYTPQIQNINIYPAITAEKANFSCPDDINEILPFGQCEMEINIGVATYGDFFGQTLTLTNNAPADNIYPEGVTTVTWTLTDECGFSVSCNQTITVTFPECPEAVDADGNEYESVRIGCDCWTKRNLESITYSDNTNIPGVYNYVSDVYPNEADNVANFGRLYDWASVIKDGADNEYGHVQGICPEGWYLPTRAKYAELNDYGVSALKSPDYWLDGGGSNTTGFTSLPGGYYDGSIDRYLNLMGEAYYWSASKVDDEWTPVPCNIRYICNQIIDATYLEGLGYSVRCIKEKDAETAPEPVFECGTSTIEDVDGNTYNTVKIGDQCWMKENLKTTKYADGTVIPQGSTASETDPYWYYPDDNSDNKATYGLLYNWSAVVQGAEFPDGVQGICPTGWHVPSDAEWTALTTYVSGQSEYQCDGNSNNIAKALSSTTGWRSSTTTCAVGNTLANNNATGFSAVPAGYYGGSYYNFGLYAYFWSATQNGSSTAYYRNLYYNSANVTRNNSGKGYGFSVRCVKDAETAPEPVFECGTSTIEDVDGNTYNTVKIGDQCWMKESLKTTKYADGTTIPQGSTLSSTDPYWYYPDDNSDNKATYGLLYNWPAVMNGATSSDANPSGVQGICPTGWHVPSDAEWTQLTNYVSSQSEYQCGGSSDNIAKALASTTGWNTSSVTCAVGNDLTANNATGFSAVPAGYYYNSGYYSFGYYANFWSATQYSSSSVYTRSLNTNYADVYPSNYFKHYGFSVRCVKDAETAPEPVFECGTSTIEDIDGNTYNTVKIGDQCWMKENLRTSTNTASTGNIYTPTTSGYDVNTYGRLYDWEAVMQGALSSDANPSGVQGICPTGWHVPSDAEWTALTTYVSGQSEYQCDGNSNNIAKALASTTDWSSSTTTCAVGNTPANNNATGFSAVPAGYYSGSYYSFGLTAYFWSATQSLSFNAYYRGLGYNGATVGRSDDSENDGYSVRCLKD